MFLKTIRGKAYLTYKGEVKEFPTIREALAYVGWTR